MDKMPDQLQRPRSVDSVRVAFRPPDHSCRESHAPRGARQRRRGVARDAHERGGRRVRLAAPAHGRGVQRVHCRGASRARRWATASVSQSCPTGTTTRWVSFRCGSSNPGSAAPSGDSRSGLLSGEAASFVQGAKAVIDFSFGIVGVHRLEARSIASNARGNAALRKVGAMQEGILRRSFQRNGRFFDQILWSILKDDWRLAHPVLTPTFH